MADPEQVKLLKRGAAEWNAWRRKLNVRPDLSGANLSYIDISGANLSGARLDRAIFTRTNLTNVDLSGAHLPRAFLVEANLANVNLTDCQLSGADFAAATLTAANLSFSDLSAADFFGAELTKAKLCDTDLTLTRFRSSTLEEADFSNALFDGTLFANLYLDDALGLETCDHFGPSVIDHITLQQSPNLPLKFLRGAGLQQSLIDALPTIHTSVEHYSCFISFSYKDLKVAEKIHSSLIAENIRCWFAPHDMKTGGKLLDQIDQAINIRDKIVLILSQSSIQSEWVEDEVTKGFEEERRRHRTVLFPIRIDETIFVAKEPWAVKLRGRHIADFRKWKSNVEFRKAIDRVMADLLRS